MKTTKKVFNNLQTMDKALANVQGGIFKVIAAREQNKNSLDDDMSETWANFRTQMQELQEEVKKVMVCITSEDGNQ
ncbi:MAG: hypothetical protein COV37_19265 [Bdellovibrio sp. CG11_big_fil_rev_8_21_14_0_20_39_38]|nr:MAG: hypothetical protein COW78_12135 [Bdellovibrio sp. CG22_combo_CG10-13_8_21_14_all_39_27]PIR32617.1 MAG: hypothetical protein COV37_19265 [Bdellovibrio sp. CG11_big_fil_rev_8_21_14_0_20_39_38]